jgi:prepilin-type N-terminal cleavage/methylation domain-containing protein
MDATRILVDGSDRQAGFTLIEVLAAMVIFAVGVLALAGLQATYIGGTAAARLQTESVTVATRVLEQLQSLPRDHEDLDPAGGSHRIPGGRTACMVEWTVFDDDPLPGAKRIRVTVVPANRRHGRPVRLSTILAR